MKYIILILLVLVPFSTLYGFSVSLDHVTGLYDANTIAARWWVTFHIRFTNDIGSAVTSSTNGFRVYSPTGSSWYPIEIEDAGTITTSGPDAMYDGGLFLNTFSATGSGADTAGFAGFSLLGTGIPDGFDEIVLTITTGLYAESDGGRLCLDTSFYPPSGNWLWTSTPDIYPDWDGPHCFDIYDVKCGWTNFESCDPIGSVSHCEPISVQFEASNWLGYPVYIYRVINGPGVIDDTGLWTYTPSKADIGPFTVEVDACSCGGCAFFTAEGSCISEGVFTNAIPVFTNCPTDPIRVCHGTSKSIQLEADPIDCDPVIYSIVSIDPTPIGTVSINSNGLLIFDSDETDLGFYTVIAEASDSVYADQCIVQFELITCTCELRGDVNHNGNRDISDLTYFVDYLFGGGPPPFVAEEGDINGNGSMDISDLTYFVAWLFDGSPEPPPCS